MSVQTAEIASRTTVPIPQDAGLPEEVQREISKGNFVRAAHIATENGVARDNFRELQSNSIRQFIEQWRSLAGAGELVQSYHLDDEEVRAILRKILENPRSHTEKVTWFNQKNGRMVATTLALRIQKDAFFGKYL